MEQPTSRPAYMFLPKPIEQQLAAYELGTLLEVYQRGWKRGPKGDRCTSKLLLLIIALGGLVGFIFSIVGIYDATQSTGIFVFGVVVIPVIFAFFACVAGIAFFTHVNLCVGAFSEGIIYAKENHVKVLRWHEIKSCEQETIKSWYGTLYLYTIHAGNGESFQLKAPYPQVENLGKVIRERIATL